jgi:hypothetical protein
MVRRTMKHSQLRNFGMSILSSFTVFQQKKLYAFLTSALDRSKWSASVSSRLTTTNGPWNRFDRWLDVPLGLSGCWRGKTNICPCQKSGPSFLSSNPSNSLSFINLTYQGLHTTLETRIVRNSNKIKVVCSKDYETAESVEHVTDTACTEKSRRIVWEDRWFEKISLGWENNTNMYLIQ